MTERASAFAISALSNGVGQHYSGGPARACFVYRALTSRGRWYVFERSSRGPLVCRFSDGRLTKRASLRHKARNDSKTPSDHRKAVGSFCTLARGINAATNGELHE